MPSRLYHSKSKAGCKLCKARRVKCDEKRPICSACERHNVNCEYETWRSGSFTPEALQVSRSTCKKASAPVSQPIIPFPTRGLRSSTAEPRQAENDVADVMIAFPGVKDCSQRTLELWLMQHFTLYTRDNFTPSVVETWVSGHKHLFFEHEFLLDSCLALSALHLSRLHPEKRYTEASNFYFGKAVEAHRSAIVQLHPGNAAAALLTSCQILAHALASTGEDMGARDEWPSKVDPTSWLQLAGQSRHIFRECRHAAGDDGDLFRLQQDVEPVMRNFDPSSKPPHRERFLFLLSHGSEYEVPTSKDKDAYERTLSLIGLIYENAGNESAIATCRRIWSTPARSPWRFIELAEEKRPRALAILAYLYASIKLIKTELWWFQGVAEKQVIRISNLLPLSWKSLIKEPLQMIGAEDGIQ